MILKLYVNERLSERDEQIDSLRVTEIMPEVSLCECTSSQIVLLMLYSYLVFLKLLLRSQAMSVRLSHWSVEGHVRSSRWSVEGHVRSSRWSVEGHVRSSRWSAVAGHVSQTVTLVCSSGPCQSNSHVGLQWRAMSVRSSCWFVVAAMLTRSSGWSVAGHVSQIVRLVCNGHFT